MAMKPTVHSMIIPFKVMEPPRQQRIRQPDLTKGENINAKVVEPLLKYPDVQDFVPPEVTPICLPGGHYRIEKFKK